MINIAIDGHAASGKSTIARELARRLQVYVFDTGSLYRALACYYRQLCLGPITPSAVAKFVASAKIQVRFEGQAQHVLVNGKDYSAQLRDEEISTLSAQLAVYPSVRALVLQEQRQFAAENDCVMEGRDITSVVLPDAICKFFVTAAAEIRAQRRWQQLPPGPGRPSFKQVLADLRARDASDENRSVAPLVITKDAIVLDTGNMTLEASVDFCIMQLEHRLKKQAQ